MIKKQKPSIHNYLGIENSKANSIKCPFHDDTGRPNLVVFENESWKCFVCGKYGDIYDYIGYSLYSDGWDKHNSEQFKEVIKKLDDQRVIPIHPAKINLKKEFSHTDTTFLTLQYATEIYHQTLLSENGKPARDYLLSRGIPIDMIKEYKIGFSFGENLSMCFSSLDLEIKLSSLKTNLYYKNREWLLNRITFPYRDSSNRVINLVGRSIDPNNKIRYLGLKSLPKPLFLGEKVLANRPTILNESIMDSLTLRKYNYQSVGLNSTTVPQSHTDIIKNSYGIVYFLAQNDIRSILGLRNSLNKIPNSRIIIPLQFNRSKLEEIWHEYLGKKYSKHEKNKKKEDWLNGFNNAYYFDYKASKDINEYNMKYGPIKLDIPE